MKLVKVNHVLLGLKVAANGGGYTQQEIDQMVNDRLAEGYDDVEIFPVRTQFGEQGAPADFVQLYVFKKYAREDEAAVAKAKK